MRERSGSSCVFTLISLLAATGFAFFGATSALAGPAPGINADTIGCFDNNYGGGATAIWYLRDANTTGAVSQWTEFGAPGTTFTPVVGRWLDDTRVSGLGLWEEVSPTLGRFHVKDIPTASGGEDDFADLVINPTFTGSTSVIPIAGAFGGTDAPGVGYYYPDDGIFVIDSSPGSPTAHAPFLFGPADAGNIYPVVGDWNGDGTDTVGVFDMTTGIWYLTDLLQGGFIDGFQFGPPNSGWIPVVGNWDLVGGDSVGFYDPVAGMFRLRNSNDAGTSDLMPLLGAPGGSCQPVVGNWNIAAP